MSYYLLDIVENFNLLGINHRNSTIQIREKFYITDKDQISLLHEAKKLGIEGIVCLSTCNRSEIYAYGDKPEILDALLINHTSGRKKELQHFAYRKKGIDAVEHLFKTAIGLDSQVIGDFQVAGQFKQAYKISKKEGTLNFFTNRLFEIGDFQVAGQFKQAYKISKKEGTLNFFTNRLFEQVFQANKAVKNSTSISKGAASIAHAAVQYIKENKKDLETTKFLLYGLGNIGKVACSNLVNHMKNRNLVLINRTEGKAQELARNYNITYKKQQDLSKELEDSGVVIVATGAKHFTVNSSHFNGVYNKKLILDLSVPRNVHSMVANINGIDLVCIDDLTQIKDGTLAERKKNIPQAKKIIKSYLNDFYEWIELRQFSPIFKTLQKKLVQLKEEELNQHKNKISVEAYKNADMISTNLINRISGQAIKHIRQKAKTYSQTLGTLTDFFKD